MYVIVEINGQQFKAEEGKKLFVHHIQNAENGATVEFDKVLLVDNNGNVTVGAPTVEGAKVVCEVASHLVKGDKVLVFHKKRRKGYKYKKNTYNRCHTFFLSCIHLLLLSQISSVNKFYLFFLTAFTADSVKHSTMRIHLKIMMLLHMLF